MSLTFEINHPTPVRDVLAKYADLGLDWRYLSSNKPFVPKEAEIKLPLDPALSHQATTLGMAFDYAARFRIAKTMGKVAQKASLTNLVADQAAIVAGMDRIYTLMSSQVENLVNEAKETVRFYYANKASLTKMLQAAYVLALFEGVARSGHFFFGSDELIPIVIEIPKGMIEELQRLLGLFESSFLPLVRPDSVVVFNPKFAVPAPIGGSDGDIYLDGTLYDFKVVSGFANWKKEEEQILGYYYLDRLAKEKKANITSFLKDCPILHLAFYEARLGEVVVCDVTGDEPFAQGYEELGSLLAK